MESYIEVSLEVGVTMLLPQQRTDCIADTAATRWWGDTSALIRLSRRA